MRVTIALVLVVAFFSTFQLESFATEGSVSTVSRSSVVRQADPVETYVDIDANGRIRFDEERAEREHASKDTIVVGRYLNDVAVAYEANPSDRLSLPVWGRYPGPGHSGPGKPVDVLDTACMHHDACYGHRGYFNCKCDQQLINEINRNLSRMKHREQQVARAIRVYFNFQKRWCRK